MRIRMIWLVLLAAAWSGQTAAQDVTGFDALNLFTGCQPVALSLELKDDERNTDLTEDRIRSMAESRLRSARLLDQTSDVALRVKAWVIGPAFHSNVSLYQPAYISLGHTWPNLRQRLIHEPSEPVTLPGAFAYAATWEHNQLGMHGGDGGYILQALSESSDAFIAEYLRVNDAACP